MPVTIQDDMLEAAEMLGEDESTRYIAAIVRYGIAGIIPNREEPWYPLFVLVRERLEMSAKAMNHGRELAKQRWSKKSHVDADEDTQGGTHVDA